jgi:methylmalonyl-CoA/ethylmalonyl-CoA epimerase
MIRGLDHIAIAVPDLALSISRFVEDFGLNCVGSEDVPTAEAQAAFFPVAETRIELVHPLDGQGPLVRYLERHGGGLHHLCFRTDDIQGDIERLKAKGYEFLTEAPYQGAHGAQVIFIHPSSCDGVLIELSQVVQDGRDPIEI